MRRTEEPPRRLAAGLKLSEDHLDTIEQSHERCAALGVSRIERPDHTPIGRPDLAVARERNRRLHDQAAPVMAMLHEQIVHSESMVVLTDATGIIIHSVGDDDFLERASKVALRPGAVWSETAKGTNAIGTALVEETPTLVHADEHYVHANHFLTCSAAPILDPRGNILGVLDVSGDHRSYHQHTMALVTMSARMIENRWLTDDYRNVLRLHFHGRVEFIGTLMEGILAVAADGRIVGANRGALEQLGLSGAALRQHTVASLFGTSVDALVDRFRSPLATPIRAHAIDGRPFDLVARFNWPAWTSLAEAMATPPAAAAAPAPTTRAAPPRDAAASALARLRSGDARVDAVIDKLRRVVDHDIPVLIHGDTGTGKEHLARSLHADSGRGRHPFVVLNCAALPEAQLEAELFGHDDGAGGGARRKGRVGRIVQAHGGVLFIDAVDELPLALQAPLLRVLQERQVTPPGGSEPVAVDVGLVCASTRSLRDAIAAGTFREDLFQRISGLAVKLPPLRERSDLAVLVQRLLDREDGGRRRAVAGDVLALFGRHPWPGNVRQLASVLHTACVLAGPAGTITRAHLSDDFMDEADRPALAATIPAPVAPADGLTLGDLETEAIRRAVDLAGGNISAAAKRLGVSRNTIYRRLRWKATR